MVNNTVCMVSNDLWHFYTEFIKQRKNAMKVPGLTNSPKISTCPAYHCGMVKTRKMCDRFQNFSLSLIQNQLLGQQDKWNVHALNARKDLNTTFLTWTILKTVFITILNVISAINKVVSLTPAFLNLNMHHKEITTFCTCYNCKICSVICVTKNG